MSDPSAILAPKTLADMFTSRQGVEAIAVATVQTASFMVFVWVYGWRFSPGWGTVVSWALFGLYSAVLFIGWAFHVYRDAEDRRDRKATQDVDAAYAVANKAREETLVARRETFVLDERLFSAHRSWAGERDSLAAALETARTERDQATRTAQAERDEAIRALETKIALDMRSVRDFANEAIATSQSAAESALARAKRAEAQVEEQIRLRDERHAEALRWQGTIRLYERAAMENGWQFNRRETSQGYTITMGSLQPWHTVETYAIFARLIAAFDTVELSHAQAFPALQDPQDNLLGPSFVEWRGGRAQWERRLARHAGRSDLQPEAVRSEERHDLEHALNLAERVPAEARSPEWPELLALLRDRLVAVGR